MKKILGLDLGTTSIGWALVNEAENHDEKSSIVKIGVRVNPLTVDEQNDFEKGKPISTNADRTLKRSMRRNLQRYKLRRGVLISCLKQHGFISDDTVLCEDGSNTTFETYRLRAKAASEQITLSEFARVLLMLNKKRGYKSSRKAKSSDEGSLVDGMEVAKHLYEYNLTPGEYSLQLLKSGKNYLPEFYQSDYLEELRKVWSIQKSFYPELLTVDLWSLLVGKSKRQTSSLLYTRLHLNTADVKAKDKRLQSLEWRVAALSTRLDKEVLAFVISELNGLVNGSSGYLGRISDRSKDLYFKHQTVGEYLMQMLNESPHNSLKNIVFYRQDYLDEFETIWETQAKYHPELTFELKKEIGQIIIFYQRPLKSQKGMVSFCEFESHQEEFEVEGKKKLITVGSRVCPTSSPLFQEFRMWQHLNNIKIILSDSSSELISHRYLTEEEKDELAAELAIKGKLTKTQVLKILFKKTKGLDLNFKEVLGNDTLAKIVEACTKIVDMSGHDGNDWEKLSAADTLHAIKSVFKSLGYTTAPLNFDSSIEGKAFEKQPMYQLWHLLYSYEGDKSPTGDNSLINKIRALFNFDNDDYAKVIAAISFKPDYGSLSTKAMRRILPFMKSGNEYSLACEYAGYRHSERSLTKEEIANKQLKDHLDLLPKNSLRNPVVEKILNQMINVVNAVRRTYGPLDEIRIEMARELKKSAKEREEMTKSINDVATRHECIRKVLIEDFGIAHPSRNDVIRYKLYEELKENGYKTLYSGTYIPREKLFSREFDIEHIIPQARLFDDSFSNKTLESRSTNQEKSNSTAYDYVHEKFGADEAARYKSRIDDLLKAKVISKSKHDKLLMTNADIPTDFINRDLRDTQYIARKAREILEDVVRVVVPTIGSVTDRLRDDWQLVNVMQELNWDKYEALGLTETYTNRDGSIVRRIKDWTKRNDHRHHAMDALTIAFTKQSYIQYLNNLNARSNKSGTIYAIEQKELYRDKNGHLRFLPPMPLDEFRAEARRQLEQTLVSIKSKTKVVTRNVNKSKTKTGVNKRVQLTPRGQLHNETIYGRSHRYVVKEEKVGAAFDEAKIATVASPAFRAALLRRLAQSAGDAKKAFTGRNSLEKNPLWIDDQHTRAVPTKVKCVTLETIYSIRKPITKDLKIDKVVDTHIRQLLKARLDECGGDSTKAFSNLDENPIWLNKAKGIKVKSVAINAGLSAPEPLRSRKDKYGKLIHTSEGDTVPSDFVQTANNHHVAIFRDADGHLQEHIVSFYEAVCRANQGLPTVDKDYRKEDGWAFMFTLKQNEYFVFPADDFCPSDVDLLNPDNAHLVSPHLYRVQKLTSKDYYFRHHLETNVEDRKELQEITWKRITSIDKLKNVVKVRVNHIGQIVAVGEY